MAPEENRPEGEDVEGHIVTERPPIIADEKEGEPDVEAHQFPEQLPEQLPEQFPEQLPE